MAAKSCGGQELCGGPIFGTKRTDCSDKFTGILVKRAVSTTDEMRLR